MNLLKNRLKTSEQQTSTNATTNNKNLDKPSSQGFFARSISLFPNDNEFTINEIESIFSNLQLQFNFIKNNLQNYSFYFCDLIDIIFPNISLQNLQKNNTTLQKLSLINNDYFTFFLISFENQMNLKMEINYCKKENKRVKDERIYKISSQLFLAIYYLQLLNINYGILCPDLICIFGEDIKLRNACYFHFLKHCNIFNYFKNLNILLKDKKDYETFLPYLAPELLSYLLTNDDDDEEKDETNQEEEDIEEEETTQEEINKTVDNKDETKEKRKKNEFFHHVNEQCDIWSIGIILLEYILGSKFIFSFNNETMNNEEDVKNLYLKIIDFVNYCKLQQEEYDMDWKEEILQENLQHLKEQEILQYDNYNNDDNTLQYNEDHENEKEEWFTDLTESDFLAFQNGWKRLQKIHISLRKIILQCLSFLPSERPTIENIINQEFFTIISKEKTNPLSFKKMKENFVNENFEIVNNLNNENLKNNLKLENELYLKWKNIIERNNENLFDLFYEKIYNLQPFIFRYQSPYLKENNLFNCSITNFISEYTFIPLNFLQESLQYYPTITTLNEIQNNHNFHKVSSKNHYASLIQISGDIGKRKKKDKLNNNNNNTLTSTFEGLLSEKERNETYQIQRVTLFRKLLFNYPNSRYEILKESMIDIPTSLRGEIWACLLGIEDDLEIEKEYQLLLKELDKNPLSIVTKRQISVDVPRCHQYHPLLNCKIGQDKLQRILEVWVYYHKDKGLVYWQGLDSLCAPLLILNYNFEAKVFACLKSIVNKYTNNFFTNLIHSTAMEERLALFQKLLCYHDPELAGHLRDIHFPPELYAISWFLTLFAHSLPMEKIFKLWDRILLGSVDLPLFLATAIIRQMKQLILQSDFNHIMILFQNLSGIDIVQVINDAKRLFEKTPNGIIDFNIFSSHHDDNEDNYDRLMMTIEEYNNKCIYPRIDRLHFTNTFSSKSFVIDIRDKIEFDKDHENCAFHILSFLEKEEDTSNKIENEQQGGEKKEENEDTLFEKCLEPLVTTLQYKRGLPIVIIGNDNCLKRLNRIEHYLLLEHVPYICVMMVK
ncbi:hypothetical protein ABK040_011015 [Willaertia magna]